MQRVSLYGQRSLCAGLSLVLFVGNGSFATPRNISMAPMLEQSAGEQTLQKMPQIAQDLDGLDPREGGISKGLRGSFVVKHYVSGPWKGGTAVIEIASDLSYAEIRIFDKDGELQRIYSIQPKSDKTRINPAQIKNPLKMVEQVNADDAAQAQSSGTSVTRSPQREAAVEAQTAQAVQEQQEERVAATAQSQAAAFSSGQSGTFTPVTQLKAGTVSSANGDIREDETSSNSRSPSSAQMAANTSSSSGTHVIRVRRKRHRKHPDSSLDTPLSGPSPNTDKDEYYYETIVVKNKPGNTAASNSSAKALATDESMQVAQLPAVQTEKESAPVPQPPASPPPSNRSSGRASGSAKSTSVMHPSAPSGTGASTPAISPEETDPLLQAVAQVRPGISQGTAAYDDARLPDVSQAVKESDADQVSAPSAATTNPKAQHPAPVANQNSQFTVANTLAAKGNAQLNSDESETTPAPSAKPAPLPSDSWKPKPTQVASLPVEEMPSPGVASAIKPSNAVTDDTIPLGDAIKRAHELDSDGWAPKPTSAHPTDAELGLTPLPAASNGKTPTVSNSAGDAMVPLSNQAKGGRQVGAGDGWAPNPSAKLTPQQEQQLAMLNNLKPVTPPRITKINQDVNNPEEGVLPFYSLEKYSGAQYGRHREFERRVVYKQNKKSGVQGYDFYIDEVDRKQEKHYLYYYKIDPKTKKAKLIATEKHEKVAFLSNYDVGTEDKGKISKE